MKIGIIVATTVLVIVGFIRLYKKHKAEGIVEIFVGVLELVSKVLTAL